MSQLHERLGGNYELSPTRPSQTVSGYAWVDTAHSGVTIKNHDKSRQATVQLHDGDGAEVAAPIYLPAATDGGIPAVSIRPGAIVSIRGYGVEVARSEA